MFKSVLIAVDGSENARKALEVACQLANEQDSRLHILHIPEALAHDTLLVWGIGAIPLEASREQLEEAGRKVIEGAAAEARQLGAAQVETAIEQGDPARVILREAESRKVDAIVMGSRGLGDFTSLVMGSVSHKVTHSAPCTVITVR